ncbi:phage major capsid protein [Sulfitobacter sp.]|uniref:phage major capsid protein n=1 Tax=Sulfitobacter sp. TaxID=1903071 RepID=UPI003F6AB308
MADLKTLREQMANAATEARSLLDQASAEKDEKRAAELEAQHDKAMADYDAMDAKAERLAKMEDIEARANEARETEERAKRESRRPGSEPGESRNGGDMDYRSAFHDYLRNEGRKGDMNPEARAVLEAGYSALNAEQRAQTTTAAAGGYSIPEQMMTEITRSMLAFGPMYDPGVTREIVTTGGNPMPWPTVNDTAVTAGAHTEGATLTDDGGKDVTFGTKQLDAFAYDTEWLRISKELMDDSFLAVETLIGALLGERLGRIANLQLTTGTGSSAPNGIVTASSLGVTAAATAAITADEIIDLQHSVDPAYRTAPGVAYMMNDSTLQAVRKLKDGQGNYLWQGGNVQVGIPQTLNGSRVVVNQQVASLGTAAKVMLFGDMQKYFVRKVGQPLIGAISDKDFWPGVGVAGYIRFDGELSDTAAIKHLITAAA